MCGKRKRNTSKGPQNEKLSRIEEKEERASAQRLALHLKALETRAAQEKRETEFTKTVIKGMSLEEERREQELKRLQRKEDLFAKTEQERELRRLAETEHLREEQLDRLESITRSRRAREYRLQQHHRMLLARTERTQKRIQLEHELQQQSPKR